MLPPGGGGATTVAAEEEAALAAAATAAMAAAPEVAEAAVVAHTLAMVANLCRAAKAAILRAVSTGWSSCTLCPHCCTTSTASFPCMCATIMGGSMRSAEANRSNFGIEQDRNNALKPANQPDQ